MIDNDVPMEAPSHQNPTLLIHGIAIPADDFKLIFDDEIIPGYVADNETIDNLGEQEPAIAGYQQPANNGVEAPASCSIRSQELPNSDKFSNIPRPLIAANCDTLARKSKLDCQSKPKEKVELKNQVSKTVIKL